MSQSLFCFASSVAGAITMLAFGSALKAHNPFLGYAGDFDEAAAACFKTAIVFLVLSAISFGTFAANAVRSKMHPQQPIRSELQAV